MNMDFLDEFDFFAGVPDSLLSGFCQYLLDKKVLGKNHFIGANEGNCVGLAAGYYLATGKTPVVYMQNSGLGNIINPVASLLNEEVYGIPCLFIIGWRGEPGKHDEPQHIFQGKITLKLLEILNIEYMVVSQDTKEETLKRKLVEWNSLFKKGKQAALVIKKGALQYDSIVERNNGHVLSREEVIRCITEYSGDAPIVSTTGKASRELYEIREAGDGNHSRDFLTVGSMGHSSSIALGFAAFKRGQKIFVIDGDGSALMHMGAMAVIGKYKPEGLVHIVINNEAHESVGGMPTVADSIDFVGMAESLGYENVVSVEDMNGLKEALSNVAKSKMLSFIEVKTAIGARSDLGRPKTSAVDNRIAFMSMMTDFAKRM